MNHRFSSHAALIELTAALLFLMLASVSILKLFTAADQWSGQAEALMQGAALAQDCAEVIAGSADPAAALAQMGYQAQESGAYALETGEMTVLASLETEPTEVGLLVSGMVTVDWRGETVVQLPVSRYYNKEVIHP